METSKTLFIPYPLAILAKEKGFLDNCIGWWFNYSGEPRLHLVEDDEGENNNFELDLSDSQAINAQQLQDEYKSSCSAPIYQQIIDWLRITHNIHILPEVNSEILYFWTLRIGVPVDKSRFRYFPNTSVSMPNEERYIKYRIEAIEEALKLI